MTIEEALDNCYGEDDDATYMVYSSESEKTGISWGPFHGRRAAAEFILNGSAYSDRYAYQCGSKGYDDMERRLGAMQ